MQPIVLVVVALAGVASTSAFADARTWCGTFRLGSTSCGYSSSEECMATVRGLGGFCYPNTSPEPPTGPPREAGIPPTRHGAIGAALSAQSLRRRNDASRSDHGTYCGTV